MKTLTRECSLALHSSDQHIISHYKINALSSMKHENEENHQLAIQF